MRAGTAGERRAEEFPGHGRERETQPHGGALLQLAFDFQLCVVAFHDAVDHGETETGAPFALGGEEWLEAAAARLLIHADA